MKKPLTENDIIILVERNEWGKIFDAVVNGSIKNPNEYIINGNNVFHIACIRTVTSFVEKIYDLCRNGKCSLNVEKENQDGFPGLHLYYKYGGASEKLLQIPSICSLDTSYTGLITYLVDSIDLLETYIDSAIKQNCLSNIELVPSSTAIKQNIFYLLIRKIQNQSSESSVTNRYLEIIKILVLNLTNQKAMHYAIYLDAENVVDFLIKEDLFDPFVKDNRKETPLILATGINSAKYVKKILEAYTGLLKSKISDRPDLVPIKDYISIYRVTNVDRPINICIDNKQYEILNILVDYLQKYRDESGDTGYHTETDEYNSTYLHNLIGQYDHEVDSFDEVQFVLRALPYFIKWTDLDQMNYDGYSSAQLIFSTGLWKEKFIAELLAGREIDLIKTDPNGKNIYSYIDDDDRSKFMELTKNIKLILNTDPVSEAESLNTLIDVVHRDQLLARKNYGLFSGPSDYRMIFMSYLRNKHSNLFVPHQVYDSEKRGNQLYIMNMTNYSLSTIQKQLNYYEGMVISHFYSFAPSQIFWYDNLLYCVHQDLVPILKKQDSHDFDLTRRFVMIDIGVVVENSGGHANVLVYDRKKREAWRFEPYGVSDLAGDNLDSMLKAILDSAYGPIHRYNSPSDYLQNIKFQTVDNEDFQIAKNLGDPGGYCVAWCMWFVDVICSNPNYEVDKLMSSYITRERIEGAFEPGSNIYLEYIRQYGHFLDAEKNKIFSSIGIKESDYYTNSPSTDSQKKLVNYLKIKKLEYD